MKSIWKYTFDVTDEPTIDMPQGARILPLVHAEHPTRLTVWAEVDTLAAVAPKGLRVVGTGHPLDTVGAYVGSVVAPPFVWHVYEAPEGQ